MDTRLKTDIPGTTYLVDVSHALDTTSKKTLSDIVLVPTPSSDPDDPLNWSPRRKTLATFCWVLYTVVNGIAGANLSSVLVPFSANTGLAVHTLTSGTGYLFLLAGWGLLFWQPFALQYGKRLTYIVSLLALTAISVWAPYCRSEGQWYARSILFGFFAAPIEALPELSVTDLYFTHERGTYLGLYAASLVGSNFFSPFMCGFINDGQGWRWVFFWPAIFCGAGAVVLFFLMEETNYDRHDPPLHHNNNPDLSIQTERLEKEGVQPSISDAPVHCNKKTYRQKLSLLDTSRPFTMHKRLVTQLIFLTFPVPVYAGFAYGSTLIWFNVLNATASTILGGPPYEFAPAIVGLTYLAAVIGTAIGMIYTGTLSDRIVLRLSRRNKGVMEPEFRLWLFAITTLLIPFSLLLWGVGSAHGVHWFGLLVAMAMLAFNNTCGASLGVNYLVDCYREMSGDALTAVIIVRNTMSFAIGYGITPWVANMGRQNAFITAAFIGMAISLLFLVMIKWGKRIRTRSKDQYWQMVARQ
ncbi:hypothetical protein FH972_024930 [Carpinus fangiana]|uniref:Major facilitator superfamily (MFS) profile domain-containing protein n=1 Tax=Carpinus fangiana TaxID=176857 RepID=A0A5N6KZJ1_9ROSI|nr:hypothetical protein FH972_024930 [Carpinus fangiana]